MRVEVFFETFKVELIFSYSKCLNGTGSVFETFSIRKAQYSKMCN